MTVPATPKLSDVIAEFGSNGSPKNLGAYVRGGAYVPNTSANSAIATSASGLKLSQFAGAKKTVPMSLSLSVSPGIPICVLPLNQTPPFQTFCTPLTSLDVAVSGGQSPFTYTWSVVTYTSPVIGASIPSPKVKNPNANISVELGTGTVTVKCEVKDAAGTTASDTLKFSVQASSGL